MWRRWPLALALAAQASCGVNTTYPPPGVTLAMGTWGGTNAGVIVNETVAHVHIGCTYGNFAAPIPLDAEGRFSVAGEYLLRAYPIAIGPTLPAQFAGVVSRGHIVLTVAVNDTVNDKLVALGPVTVTYGKQPQMGPCPICRVPPLELLPGRGGWSMEPPRPDTGHRNP